MVGEVNKIVGNLLLSSGEVCIDGVGSLFTLRKGATRTSRKSVVPPYRIVGFTTEQRGPSLREEIARVAGVDAQRATELFDRWLSEVLDGDTLTIEGVGVLRCEEFVADEAFAALLNPQGRTPVRLKPKPNVALYIFAVVSILFALVVAGYLYVDNHDIALFGAQEQTVATSHSATDGATQAPNKVTAQPVDSVAVSVSATEATEAVAQVHNQPQSQPQPVTAESVAEAIGYTTQGRSYVVLGVFSTAENAAKAIGQAQAQADNVRCEVYHYGEKYMVALYSAESRGECQEFARSLGDTFNDLWIYSRK